MKLDALLEKEGFSLLNPQGTYDRDITGGYCCDLLSWVMARGEAGMAWVTVQTHMNVVAIASLHEFACIILCDGGVMDPDVLKKAAQEGIAVVSADKSAYAVCGILHDMGV